MRGMFSNIRPGLNLPNDAQCAKCKLFDTGRQDVLDILWAEQQRAGKAAPTVAQARCTCNDQESVRPRYSDEVRV